MAVAHDQVQNSFVNRVRALAKESNFLGEIGVSRLDDGVVVRVLTSTGDDAFRFIRSVSEFVR
jgi:urease accessory protein